MIDFKKQFSQLISSCLSQVENCRDIERQVPREECETVPKEVCENVPKQVESKQNCRYFAFQLMPTCCRWRSSSAPKSPEKTVSRYSNFGNQIKLWKPDQRYRRVKYLVSGAAAAVRPSDEAGVRASRQGGSFDHFISSTSSTSACTCSDKFYGIIWEFFPT